MAPSLPPLPRSQHRAIGQARPRWSKAGCHRLAVTVMAVLATGSVVATACSSGQAGGVDAVNGNGNAEGALAAVATAPTPSVATSSDPGVLTATTGPRPGPTTRADENGGTGAAIQPEPQGQPTSAPGSGAVAAPEWLGQRPLPTGPDGRVEVPQTTPAELENRRFVTVDRLPPPPSDRFISSIESVSEAVLARSTWGPDCPVEPDDLAYVTVAFWGFDGRPHAGELLVNRSAAADLVWVFEQLHQARFPIEEMRITTRAELDAEPTGDGNNTGAFVCRAVTGGSSFSEHAYGLAVDINPFHNPYRRADLILPELAGHYLDRGLTQPGMIVADDVVVESFATIGWGWGGAWESLEDYHHFSHNGR